MYYSLMGRSADTWHLWLDGLARDGRWLCYATCWLKWPKWKIIISEYRRPSYLVPISWIKFQLEMELIGEIDPQHKLVEELLGKASVFWLQDSPSLMNCSCVSAEFRMHCEGDVNFELIVGAECSFPVFALDWLEVRLRGNVVRLQQLRSLLWNGPVKRVWPGNVDCTARNET